jgi:hypothetical protein
LICCTGWHCPPGVKFCSESQTIGDPPVLPTFLGQKSADGSERATKDTYWQKGPDSIIEQEIPFTFPALSFRPSPAPTIARNSGVHSIFSHRNFMLYAFYRFMVPPSFIDSHSTAYAGFMTTKPSALYAQAQASWIVVYLSAGNQKDN